MTMNSTTIKKSAAAYQAALRRKAAAELRATLKRSKLALEQSQREHEEAFPSTPPQKKSFWQRFEDWFTG
jgi:hypothetical protein